MCDYGDATGMDAMSSGETQYSGRWVTITSTETRGRSILEIAQQRRVLGDVGRSLC